MAALPLVNPSIFSVELNDLQNPVSVVLGHRHTGRTLALDLSREFDGLRRFDANLLAVYPKPLKQTSIFEHPEDGIHPRALDARGRASGRTGPGAWAGHPDNV